MSDTCILLGVWQAPSYLLNICSHLTRTQESDDRNRQVYEKEVSEKGRDKKSKKKSESFGGDKEGLDQQASQGGTIAIFLAKSISGLPLDRNRLYWSPRRYVFLRYANITYVCMYCFYYFYFLCISWISCMTCITCDWLWREGQKWFGQSDFPHFFQILRHVHPVVPQDLEERATTSHFPSIFSL